MNGHTFSLVNESSAREMDASVSCNSISCRVELFNLNRVNRLTLKGAYRKW